MRFWTLGDQEFDLLRYIADHAPISIGGLAEQYGEPRGLARTTVLTMTERLRKKGYLTREKPDGVYQYSPKMAKAELMRGVVGEFMQRALDGSVEPFMAYLTEDAHLSPDEIRKLKALVEQLDDDTHEGGK